MKKKMIARGNSHDKAKKNIIVWGNSEDKANSFVLKKTKNKKLASVFGSFPDGEVVPFFSRYVLGLSDTLYTSTFPFDDKYRQKATMTNIEPKCNKQAD